MNDYTALRDVVAGAIHSMHVSADRTQLAALLAEVDQLRAAAPKKKPSAKKAALAATVDATVDTLPTWLPVDAWTAFLEMRKKIKKPATEYAQKLLLKKLAAFYANEFDPLQILNQSTLNGWQDLYAPKEIGAALRGQFAQRPAVADQNRANNQEALRLLGQPMFADDGMTIEAAP